MLKYLLCIIPLIFGYELIDNYKPTTHKELTFCSSTEPILRETTIQAVNKINEQNILYVSLKDNNTITKNEEDNINKYEILYLSLHDNKTIKSNTNDNINSICSFNNYAGIFGYTSFYDNNYETDISISQRLYNTPTTLENVIFHEVLHSVGLNHTLIDGLMNYTLRIEPTGYIVNDDMRLWLSIDDIKGLRFIKRLSCPINKL